MSQLGYDVIEPALQPPSLSLGKEITPQVVNEYSFACRVTDNGYGQKATRPVRGISIVNALAAELVGKFCWWLNRNETTALLLFPYGHPDT